MHSKGLFPPQREVVEHGFLDSGFHCLLNMSTGTGKTHLAEMAIRKSLENGYRAIYLTPLRALADEKYNQWKQTFAAYSIGIFTGDILSKNMKQSDYRSAQILIMTPERLDACLRNWRAHWTWIPEVDILVIDEFHLLSDPNRGPRLEGTITRILRLNPFARILGLSATLPNAESLSDWLNGVHYSSNWRHIPLDKRIVKFTSPKDKLQLLKDIVHQCTSSQGQSLVFVNSRSRAQSVSQYLNDNGFKSYYHHAGLKYDDRKKVEDSFRNGETQVLVATATLEMGLNLPARQVVIYDSYSFIGTGFTNLPVWSFIQRSGRAGRPGMDVTGQVVMLAPKWVGGLDKYINEECEPVCSQLNNSKAMGEQILIELFAGYSRNRNDLTDGFLPITLFKHQHPNADINKTINTLIVSDMLIIKDEESTNGNMVSSLKPSKLGKLAVKLMFSPSTVKLIKDFYTHIEKLHFFDLLIIASINEDCSPVLQTNFEDLDNLVDIVQDLQSSILEMSLDRVKKVSTECPSTIRLLAGVKMAAICYAVTEGKSKEELAKSFDIYEADIDMLKDNVIRLLSGMSAIMGAISQPDSSDEDEPVQNLNNHPSRLCTMLANMIHYEIDSIGVNITNISGVGGKIAKELIGNGYSTIEQISLESSKNLSKLPGIGLKLAKKIIDGAKELLKGNECLIYIEEKVNHIHSLPQLKLPICPYRLRRSLELRVRGHEGKYFYVTGGREDHIVTKHNDIFYCDCQDYEKNRHDCKHILCVRRVLMDKEICTLITKIKEDKNNSLRTAIPSLWYSVSIPE